jgi:hypothetical protein
MTHARVHGSTLTRVVITLRDFQFHIARANEKSISWVAFFCASFAHRCREEFFLLDMRLIVSF